ncbi:uncharacterized protein YgbK (DUF1537 family) [Ilumatobacter fluminis]|uniref:Uncharacterized protein YgbK (DUF1537 family) n=1 Tax=Ilumatobacter fluminis TaxID=467091 RepID=A0A4R7HZN4_9ACTN|nr:uncharacterized protein YgbK (DUF1537 family) [Ilumatobacter fluminis]
MSETYRAGCTRQNADVELLVAADDRTGAFESAAVLADHGTGPVAVTAWPRTSASERPIGVLDLGSRHLSPADAADRVDVLPDATFHAHKIDSTLRGNWPTELAARARTKPVLLVPSLPSLGRTCEGGVVLELGRPVHEGNAATDVRRAVRTSRPVEALLQAGEHDASEVTVRDGLDAWLAAPHGVAVVDAVDDDEIDEIVARWTEHAADVVLAGTSAAVGAAAAVVAHDDDTLDVPPVDGSVLVVCGSVHPASRRQIDFAERRGIPVSSIADDIAARQLQREGTLVIATEIPVGDVDEPMAVAAASALARGVHDIRRHVELGAIVILGGDTATAVIGDADVEVLGSLGPGEAWVDAAGFDAPIVTRSGGFGADHALVDLLDRLRRP